MSQSRTFHLHIDATVMPESLYKVLRDDMGFWDSEFSGHPQGYDHFAPNRHVTLKFTEGTKFRKACNDLEILVSRTPTLSAISKVNIFAKSVLFLFLHIQKNQFHSGLAGGGLMGHHLNSSVRASFTSRSTRTIQIPI